MICMILTQVLDKSKSVPLLLTISIYAIKVWDMIFLSCESVRSTVVANVFKKIDITTYY